MTKVCFLGNIMSPNLYRWVDYFIASKKFKVSIISILEKNNMAQIEKKYKKRIHLFEISHIKPEGGNYKYLLFLPKIFKTILRSKPDVLIAHYVTSWGFIGAIIKLFFPKIKLLTYVYGSDVLITKRKNWIYNIIILFSLFMNNIIIVDAKYIYDDIKKNYCLERKKYIILKGLGYNSKIFKTRRTNKKFHLISTRNLILNSNIFFILDILSKLKKKNKFIKLALVGDGYLKEKILEYIKQNNLSENVEYFGYVSQEKLGLLLSKSSIYIEAVTSDAISSSVMEAMACDCIPVVNNLLPKQELIKNFDNGFLYEFNQKDYLVKLISRILRDKNLQKKIIEKNKLLMKRYGKFEKKMNMIINTLEKIEKNKFIPNVVKE